MKKIILAVALAGASVPAHAGSNEAPQMDVTVITQGAGASGAQAYIVPLVFLTMIVLLLSGGTAPVRT